MSSIIKLSLVTTHYRHLLGPMPWSSLGTGASRRLVIKATSCQLAVKTVVSLVVVDYRVVPTIGHICEDSC